MAELPTGHLAISRWTEVEFAALMARDVRMGGMNPSEAHAMEMLFEEAVGQSLVVWLPEAGDYVLGQTLLAAIRDRTAGRRRFASRNCDQP